MTTTIALVMPAFRPPPVFPDVIGGITSLDSDGLIHSIIVVDDGSGTAYAGVFAAAARFPRVTVVRRDLNGGQGAALKTGIAYALKHVPDLAGVVTADADGQHSPRDVVMIAHAFVRQPDAVILGVRAFGRDVPLRSRIGNVLTKRLVAWLGGLAVADTQTGLRGWPRRACERNLRNPASGFEFNLSTLLAAAAAGDTIVERPIQTIYEPGNPTSHFRPLQDSIRIYRVLAGHAARRLTGVSGDWAE
jgi:glycosyltransferase involved in cell wall biosynthesis